MTLTGGYASFNALTFASCLHLNDVDGNKSLTIVTSKGCQSPEPHVAVFAVAIFGVCVCVYLF